VALPSLDVLRTATPGPPYTGYQSFAIAAHKTTAIWPVFATLSPRASGR
jgi:hypothetical protein